MTLLGLILCEESIARIPKLENAFMNLIQGNKSVYWSENMKMNMKKIWKIEFFFWKSSFLGFFYARNPKNMLSSRKNASLNQG